MEAAGAFVFASDASLQDAGGIARSRGPEARHNQARPTPELPHASRQEAGGSERRRTCEGRAARGGDATTTTKPRTQPQELLKTSRTEAATAPQPPNDQRVLAHPPTIPGTFARRPADNARGLEGVASEAEQRETSNFFADHIVNVSCTLDGVSVTNSDDFRFESPQFAFTAPSPWIFGETGGKGTSVADGYYVFLKPLHPGMHVLNISGTFVFTMEADGFDFVLEIDTTYNLTQLGQNGHHHDGDDRDDD